MSADSSVSNFFSFVDFNKISDSYFIQFDKERNFKQFTLLSPGGVRIGRYETFSELNDAMVDHIFNEYS